MPKDEVVMNYVVIDTNVIVSAFLALNRPESIPMSIIKAVFTGRITPVLTVSIMEKYKNVLAREKFGFDQKLVEVFLSEFKSQAVFVNPPTSHRSLPDPKDVCFYEAALVYENIGGLLVTGNTKHYPNCPFSVTPTQLKERLSLL